MIIFATETKNTVAKDFIIELLKKEFKGKESFSREELFDFYRQFEIDLKESTFRWRIHDLKANKIITAIKRGHFTFSYKPIFAPNIDEFEKKISGKIEKQFELRVTCIGSHLIAVKIQFGYTLLIEPWCIHGDSTMYGLYSMAMTGNHNAMGTADTVFIKNSTNKYNIKCVFNDIQCILDQNLYDLKPINLLLTSNKLAKTDLVKIDTKIKDYIMKTHNHFIGNLFQPVILTPYKTFGWKKTIGTLIK